jgi:hypothetical protein
MTVLKYGLERQEEGVPFDLNVDSHRAQIPPLLIAICEMPKAGGWWSPLVVEALLAAGCRVDYGDVEITGDTTFWRTTKDRDPGSLRGPSVLHYVVVHARHDSPASARRRLAICAMLVDAGADPLVSFKGKLPVDGSLVNGTAADFSSALVGVGHPLTLLLGAFEARAKLRTVSIASIKAMGLPAEDEEDHIEQMGDVGRFLGRVTAISGLQSRPELNETGCVVVTHYLSGDHFRCGVWLDSFDGDDENDSKSEDEEDKVDLSTDVELISIREENLGLCFHDDKHGVYTGVPLNREDDEWLPFSTIMEFPIALMRLNLLHKVFGGRMSRRGAPSKGVDDLASGV